MVGGDGLQTSLPSAHHTKGEEEALQDLSRAVWCRDIYNDYSYYLEGTAPDISHKKGKMLSYKVTAFIFSTVQCLHVRGGSARGALLCAS